MNEVFTLLAYCREHYLNATDYAAATGLSPQHLAELVSAGCIPAPAFRLTGGLSMPAGVFPAAHWDLASDWYAPSLVPWAQQAARLSEQRSPADVVTLFKSQFDAAFDHAVRTVPDAALAYPDCYPDGRWDTAAIARRAAEAWCDVLDGTYGVCLREVCADNVVRKAVAIWQLQRLLADDMPTAKDAGRWLAAFDAVTMPFAPHQRALSSRGRLADPLRARLAEAEASRPGATASVAPWARLGGWLQG